MEITDSHWITNRKTVFMYGMWNNIQLNMRSASETVQKFPGKLKSQDELVF